MAQTSPSPPPPFSPAFEASLLLPLPALPPLWFDPLSFVTLNFPSSAGGASASSYGGLLTQVTRAVTASVAKRSTAQQPDSTDDHFQARTGIGQVVEVCLELLESVKVMKELEDESINRREQQAARGGRDRQREKEGSERKSNTPSTPRTPPSTSSSTSSSSSSSSSSTSSAGGSTSQSSSGSSSGSLSADFEALDSLRVHLVRTIRSLRSLSLLIAAIDALPLLFPARDYPAMSKLLAYITRLQAALASYSALPLLSTLSSHRSTHLIALQRLILQDLYATLPKLPADADIDSIALRVTLLDQYLPSVRDELIQWFSQCRLQPFLARCSTTATSSPHSPASPQSPAARFSSITQVDAMYKMLYTELSDYSIDSYDRVFPPHWHTPSHLCRLYTQYALQHIQTMLADHAERGERIDLYKPLQETQAVEEYLQREVVVEDEQRDGVVVPKWEWKGLISSAFNPYIHTFVVMEQERFSKALSKIEREEVWVPNEVAEGVELGRLTGFDKLLSVIDKSVEKYSRLIHNETMFGLVKEYRRAVLEYVRMLERHIPNVGGGPTASSPNASPSAAISTHAGSPSPSLAVGGGGSSGTNIMLSKQEVASVLLILHTADYALTRLPSLTDSCKRAVEDEYAQYVSFDAVQEKVAKVHTKATATLSLSLCNKLDAQILSTVKDAKRDMLGHAGEESGFVKQLVAVSKREIAKLTGLSSYPQILHAFLSKFLLVYVQRLKVGVISDVWADQLLLDTQTLRAHLETLPGIKRDPAAHTRTKGKKKANAAEEKEKEKEKGATTAVQAAEDRREEKEKDSQHTQTDFSATAPSLMQKELSKDDVKQAAINGSATASATATITTTAATAPTSAATSPTHSLTTSLSASPIIAPAQPPTASMPPSASSSALNLAAAPTAAPSTQQAELSAAQPAASQPSDPYLLLIAHHLLPLERMLRVLSSPSPQLIQSFRKAWPKGQSQLLQEMMDLRGLTSRDQERLVKVWNASVGDKSSKRVEWVQRDFMTNFFGDIKKSIQTNL